MQGPGDAGEPHAHASSVRHLAAALQVAAARRVARVGPTVQAAPRAAARLELERAAPRDRAAAAAAARRCERRAVPPRLAAPRQPRARARARPRYQHVQGDLQALVPQRQLSGGCGVRNCRQGLGVGCRWCACRGARRRAACVHERRLHRLKVRHERRCAWPFKRML